MRAKAKKVEPDSAATVTPQKPGKVFSNKRFSSTSLILFVSLFAVVGAYFIFRTFAAGPLVASVQAENMVLPSGATIVNDTSASSGQAVILTNNGNLTASISLPTEVESLAVTAKGSQCSGAPTMNLSIDGNNLLNATAVSSSSWTTYSVSPPNLIPAGTHSLSISFTNDYTKSRGNSGKNSCSRDLFVDITSFYGKSPLPTPAPTVTLSASPASLTAGSSSTLTWNSTNATTCNASGAWSGTKATSGSSSTGALNQTSTYTLTCTGSGGSVSASATITVSPISSTNTYASVTSFPKPAFTPNRTVVVTSQAQLSGAISNLQPGDYIDAQGGFTVTGELIVSKRLSSWAEIHLNNTKFVGTSAGSNLPSIWLSNVQYIRFYGGDFTNVGGTGVLVYGSQYLTWWDFKVHDTGGGCFSVHPLNSNSTNIDLKGEVYNCGLNYAFDPHSEKGTGLHGLYLGGTNNSYRISDSRFALDVHDQPSGAAIEVNQLGSNVKIYLRAKRLTFVAKSQVAGNGLQFWGEPMSGLTVPYIECEDLTGRCVDSNGMYSSGGLTGSVVQYGRATNTNKNPYLGSTEPDISPSATWDRRDGITYQDILPSL